MTGRSSEASNDCYPGQGKETVLRPTEAEPDHGPGDLVHTQWVVSSAVGERQITTGRRGLTIDDFCQDLDRQLIHRRFGDETTSRALTNLQLGLGGVKKSESTATFVVVAVMTSRVCLLLLPLSLIPSTRPHHSLP